MPFYMDFHQFEDVTLDVVRTAHTADESIQEKYGVRYHQYWVNQKGGTVFCLVEGPDAETCELVHQMAHGNVACAMTEVEPVSFKLFMGDKFTIDHGLTRSEDGEIDDGYRFILVASIRGTNAVIDSPDSYRLQIPGWAKEKVTEYIKSHRGRTRKWEEDDTFIGVFNEANDAIKCAEEIRKELESRTERQVVFKIGISAEQPVTRDGDFFTKAIRLGHRLCATANDNQILVSALATKLGRPRKNSSQVRFLDIPEEEFVFSLLDIIESKLAHENFNVATICKEIGISRPQLYRKITTLTGRAPNDFLRDLRLERSLTHLKQRTKNIAQVAMEIGYSNPSYFTKCFADKFGCVPSELFSR